MGTPVSAVTIIDTMQLNRTGKSQYSETEAAEELGISDWAIDKLAGRVRSKLKLQDNNYELQTVKTRGYKLIEVK